MATDALNYSLITPDIEKNLVVQSKYIAWSIIISYIMFTKVIGPSIMKNRKPMDLQLTMLLYNGLLVAFNAYLASQVIEIAVDIWPYRCNIKESPLYKDTDKFFTTAMLILLVKFLELFDTVIFILRKKFQQVSFLHVYHHSLVFILYWTCLRFRLEAYYVVLTGAINLSIHVALYLYYALSALGPGVRKYLWWKKYLTTVQIIQFFIIMLYMVLNSLIGCGSFNIFDKVVFAGVAMVAALFLNFYFRTYKSPKKTS